MAKDSPSLPDAPKYKEDPRFSEGLDKLFGLGERMTSFDFEGDLGPLADTISTSPETTQMFLTGLKAQLDPIFRDLRTQTINELAASNQLESSVANTAFTRQDMDLQNAYLAQSSAFGLADIERALGNRLKLFGQGLETTTTATGLAGEESQFRNKFNLANYENIVSKSLYDQSNEEGGLMGGLTGAAGGAMAGSMFGPVGMVVGGLAGGAGGYFGPQGTGGQIFQAGAGLKGGMTAAPRSTAFDTDLSGGLLQDLDLNDLLANYGRN